MKENRSFYFFPEQNPKNFHDITTIYEAERSGPKLSI